MTTVAADGPEDFMMSIQSNTFCWYGISTDIDSGTAFYKSVLGWNLAADSDGPPVFVAPGGAVAHLQAPDNGPPSWCSYWAVDDVDASTAMAAEHRGTILVPPTDLPVGRFSIVTTPSGAAFGLYQAAEGDAMAAPGPGTIHWVELHSTAPDNDLAWLRSVFGVTSRVQQMAAGPYHLLESDGASVGGVTTSQMERSVFMAWVQVADLDATVAEVSAHGGTTVTRAFADPAVGRMAVVADPSGATFGLIQPA